jgi:hypothetical protein
MRRISSLTVALGLSMLLTGCPVDHDPQALTIVNQTDQPVTTSGTNTTLKPHGGDFAFVVDGCSDRDITATWPDGTAVASLTQRWCGDQTWTIRADGESTLTDDG